MNLAEIRERAEDAAKGISGPDAAILGADCLALLVALDECQGQRRKLIARQSTIRAVLERLRAQASGDDSDYGIGIRHAVGTILAAVQDLEDGTTPAPILPE